MKLRVLLISHTCQSVRAGQPKAQVIGAQPDIDLLVLTPERWRMYGQWFLAETPLPDASFKYQPQPIRFPWLPGAQNYFHYYPGFRALLRDFQPDVLDIWEEPYSHVSYHATKLARKLLPNCKVIMETEQNIHKVLPPPFAQFRRWMCRHADFLVGRNQEALTVMAREGYRGPGQVVPNAVDTDLFVPQDKAAARAKLNLSGFVLGYFGRLVHEKGLDDLLDAVPLLPPETRILFVGDGPHKPALLAKATALGIADRLDIRPGVPLEQLPAYFSALDVFVLPSRTEQNWKEQFGRVIIEAMSCGTPVAGSDSGAIPEVIKTTGEVFKERNPQDLARAIRNLHNNPARQAALAREGRHRATAEFSWQTVGQTMTQIYRTLTSPPSKS